MLALTLELERGAVATVQVVWQRQGLPRTYELDVIGDDARVTGVLDPEFRATGLADGVPVDLRAAAPPSVRSVERFLAAARSGDPAAVACTPAAGHGLARHGAGLRAGAAERRARQRLRRLTRPPGAVVTKPRR